MNDYIVWYSDENNQNKFSKEFSLNELISQNHLDEISDSPLLKNFKIDSINNGIGIKDINDKNIYSDCSIVEFQWTNGFGNVQTDWGVFKYNLDYLQYLIYEENEDINKSFIKDVFNIKIIDTIQENKLGLIK